MNEEEKQAIEYLERHLLPYCREGNIKFMLNDVILNLIKKQQKEIEKLKSKKYILNAETKEIKEIPISDDYISKDKIKEKIENLKQYKEEIKEEKDFEYFTTLRIIKTLKSLLGE